MRMLKRACAAILFMFLILGIMPVAAFAGTSAGTVNVVAAAEDPPEPLEARIEVSYKGFNGSKEFELEVIQGQEVELTFVWADSSVPDNAHRMQISGYDLETELLTKDNPEVTLSFVADQAGEFTIFCNWQCEGHKEALQNGELKVAGSDSSGVSKIDTAVTLNSQAQDADIVLRAQLTDASGVPIRGAPIRFVLEGELLGAAGTMKIGEAETDSAGYAIITYTPRAEGPHMLGAVFGGNGRYAESDVYLDIEISDSTPAYTVEPKGLGNIGQWTLRVIGLIAITIWSIYAYVLFQVHRIKERR